jgi:hypothetical protein
MDFCQNYLSAKFNFFLPYVKLSSAPQRKQSKSHHFGFHFHFAFLVESNQLMCNLLFKTLSKNKKLFNLARFSLLAASMCRLKLGWFILNLNAYKNKLLLSRDQDGTFEKKNVIRLKGCIWEKARSMIQGEKIFDPNWTIVLRQSLLQHWLDCSGCST